MKKPNKVQKSGNPMKGDLAFGYHPPRPALPPGSKIGGELILKPETWKKINDIAADPEKYLDDEDEFRDECGLN